jgi:CDP-glucose 4,6-dehydratase
MAMPISSLVALRNRRVFLTGHTGFKGSWLTLWLHRLGAQITGYALPPKTQPNCFEAARVHSCLAAHHEADIRDKAKLELYLLAAKPEVVLHLAAQPLVRESYRTPAETFAVNVQGTVHLLEAVRQLNSPCVVIVITSDKCYLNREQVWGYRECDALGGHDPYSASKAAAEIVTASYRDSFFPSGQLARHGVRVASARAGNVIGGGDWSQDRIVTDIVRCMQNGQQVGVRNPHAVRPWQHVLEPLSGYLTLAARMIAEPDARLCSAWNFGPMSGEELPVGKLVKLFLEAWGSGSWRDLSAPNAPHEAGVLRLAIDKAIWELGWRPRWSVRDAVTRTAKWYRDFAAGGDMAAACLADIRAYEAAISSTPR